MTHLPAGELPLENHCVKGLLVQFAPVDGSRGLQGLPIPQSSLAPQTPDTCLPSLNLSFFLEPSDLLVPTPGFPRGPDFGSPFRTSTPTPLWQPPVHANPQLPRILLSPQSPALPPPPWPCRQPAPLRAAPCSLPAPGPPFSGAQASSPSGPTSTSG